MGAGMAKAENAFSAIEANAVWARQLTDELKRRNEPVSDALASSGLSEQSLNSADGHVPFMKVAAFFEHAAEVTNNPILGLQFAQSRDVRDAGLIGFVGLSSPTVADFIINLSRYQRVFSDAAGLDISQLRDQGRMTWRFRRPQLQNIRQYREFAAANFVSAIRNLTGRNIRPTRLCFVHPRNSNLSEFDRFYGCDVEFGCELNVCEFRADDLNTRLLTSDEKLLNFLKGVCEEVLEKRRTHPSGLLEKMEKAIVAKLSKGEASLDIVAIELGMSSRTLSRRLDELDTSYKEVLNTVRRALAERYLKDSALSVAQIAYLVGYAEVSTFVNAFKRWTGMTPGAYRSQIQS